MKNLKEDILGDYVTPCLLFLCFLTNRLVPLCLQAEKISFFITVKHDFKFFSNTKIVPARHSREWSCSANNFKFQSKKSISGHILDWLNLTLQTF